MEGGYGKGGEVGPQLLDLIPNGKDWMGMDSQGVDASGFGIAEEKKLELRLGPPGGEDWPQVKEKREGTHASLPSLGHFSNAPKSFTITQSGAKRAYFDAVDSKLEGFPQKQLQQPVFLQPTKLSHKTDGKTVQLQQLKQLKHGAIESKADCLSPAHAAADSRNAAGTNNASQRRVTSAPVVGWPPVRAFRKNLTSSSFIPPIESQNVNLKSDVKIENSKSGLFLKINMDGIPIGRKIDLKAYDSYKKLSSAVQDLFPGLLAVKRIPPAAGVHASPEENEAFTGLLDGSGEYTLVYEDGEGDRMLVGDIPWDLFISTAKRLRVLKTSELSLLSLKTTTRKRTAVC